MGRYGREASSRRAWGLSSRSRRKKPPLHTRPVEGCECQACTELRKKESERG